VLKSTHIYLRKLQPGDAPFLLIWENNPENWEVSGTTKPFTNEEIENFVDSEHDLSQNQQLRLVVCVNETDKPIGTIDLFEFDKEKNSVGIGVLIAEKEFRNKGFANEALKLMVKYCLNELQIVHLFCNIFKENHQSIRLFKKNGFQFIEERVLFGKEVNYYELTLEKDV